MTDSETLSVYATKAQDYADLIDAAAADDPRLTTFIAALPAGGHVLDLGSGPGNYAARMAQAGLRVTAFDPVAEMVALAGAHPGVTAVQASFDDLDAVSEYDGIWANFSLLHAPRADIPRHLAAIAKALKPAGRFHIGVKTGTGETRDKIGRLYTYFTEEELRALLSDAGFTIEGATHGADAGLSGEVAPWVCISAHA